MNILQLSVNNLKGVGFKLVAYLSNLKLYTLKDLLFHLPLKYVDLTKISPISSININDFVLIEGIVKTSKILLKPKRTLLITIYDYSGSITVLFFNFNMQQYTHFKCGIKVRLSGKVKIYNNKRSLVHPEYKIINKIIPIEKRLTPIYPTCKGISQNLLRNLCQQTLHLLYPIQDKIETLPKKFIKELGFLSLFNTLQYLHAPTPNLDINKLKKRLAFDELLTQHLVLINKRKYMHHLNSYAIPINDKYWNKFLHNLPFKLTQDQQDIINIIKKDLQKSNPMIRLIQGDVGSGKTIIAVAAALQVIAADMQVALMAPTAILAEQHWYNIKQWFKTLSIEVLLLTGNLTYTNKKHIYDKIINGNIKFIIGTHALVQNNLKFNKLALVIIDEQHKFGVNQRLALNKKGIQVHQLIMTATPIPRTLAMTYYADMDHSIINKLPPNRKPVATLIVNKHRRHEILKSIKTICAHGQQVYWVCTLIVESRHLNCTSANKVLKDLNIELKDLNVSMIYGGMKIHDKEKIMKEFSKGNINVLVSTTVIEVGMDVPNASLIVIENPERLGLAQLHQLRGRVGRGNAQSYCIILYNPPLSSKMMQRLKILRDAKNGFDLAEFDLKLRGPGEVCGTKQSGLTNLHIANLIQDKNLVPKIIYIANLIINNQNLIKNLMQLYNYENAHYHVV